MLLSKLIKNLNNKLEVNGDFDVIKVFFDQSYSDEISLSGFPLHEKDKIWMKSFLIKKYGI